ncbi:prepilin-type N-terminal cleavage/methylation domain-containing protein [Elusimicrobium posterum]|uniref:type II secretion system protein n=1 Tax=Elusimicrobium posterum TaxID=3116653 RepID=UPI003C734C31
MMNKKGFTLVEVLVALFLTGLVMVALVGVWMSTTNFAASNRDEILYRNAFSYASKMLEGDLKGANLVYIPTGRTEVSIFRNFYADDFFSGTGKCINSDPARVINYCAVANSDGSYTLYRDEATAACTGGGENVTIPQADACSGDPEVIITNLMVPTNSNGNYFFYSALEQPYELGNWVTINMSGRVLVGKSQRPVTLNFRKQYQYYPANS